MLQAVMGFLVLIAGWEMSVGPLQEEYVLLSNEPFPHPLESLMVTNSLILLPCDSFISFSYLMDYFAVYRSHLGLLKPSLYCLLPSVASDEKFTATCVIVPLYVMCHFPLYFQDVKMCLS